VDTARYAELFLTESQDNLSAINHALLELERTPNAREPVGALFRAVHTVKGMSATMGYVAVAELSHELETLLDLVRRGQRDVTAPLMDTLFSTADMLERAVELSVAGRGDELDIAPTIAALRAGGPAATSSAEGAVGEPTTTRRKKRSTKAGSAGAPAATVTVVVTMEPNTPMPGVRAYLAIERARTLGTVARTTPAQELLDRDEFDGTVTIDLASVAPDEEIERVVRSAGFVAEVRVARSGGGASGAAQLPHNGAEPPRSAGRASELAPARQHRHIRIDLHRLDTMMNLIGELVITRGRLQQLASTINDPALTETVTQASRLVADLQDGIMTSRMVPVWQVFDRFPRVVRDAARALGKQVDFVVEGQEIELDRSLLDEIGDPVVHLLRNAIDHGLEMPD